MKILLKILTGLALFIFLIAAAIRLFVHEGEPQGIPSPEADVLAQKMFKAINKTAWDSTTIVQWDFAGRHKFLWDKKRHFTQVEWEKTKVLLDINNISGKVFEEGKEITGDAAKETLKTAWDYFNNDSFWLNAPAKAFDGGTQRSIVKLSDGREGLKVQYTSGGTTPGDSYVWILDEKGMPSSYKMWVSIIPIGGLEFGWTDFKNLYSGAKVAQMHKSNVFDIKISDLKAGESFLDFGLTSDPFKDL